MQFSCLEVFGHKKIPQKKQGMLVSSAVRLVI
jgi:hypothetical protein